MKYASDNRLVKGAYELACGRYRVVFYLAVAAAVGIGLYMPARDFYTAYRASYILERQMEIRKAYNDSLEAEVDRYLSKEGIEEAAREQGMVMPGEKTITVTGADDSDGGKGSDKDSDAPMTSVEVEQAEQAVYDDCPWYFQVLDAVFFFDADEGRQVSSTGDSSAK